MKPPDIKTICSQPTDKPSAKSNITQKESISVQSVWCFLRES